MEEFKLGDGWVKWSSGMYGKVVLVKVVPPVGQVDQCVSDGEFVTPKF